MARSLNARAAARQHLISVAGLVGRPVRLSDGRQIGQVADVVLRWASDLYPAVTGLIARMAGHRTFVPIARITELGGAAIVLSSSVLDLRAFERREGETLLMADVVDHQLVDVNGVQVVRASDLYLAELGARVRLVGVETGILPLARRLGPARWRTRATPSRVIDWADIHPAGHSAPGNGSAVQLDRANRELRRMRPGDLADLVESLGHADRAHLVTALDAELAADVLEEMEDAPRQHVLRHLDPARVAPILAAMEPDEAADALRDLPTRERRALLAAVPPSTRVALESLLTYRSGTAGGIMTTALATLRSGDTVGDATNLLRELAGHRADIDAVLVLANDGTLVDDVSLFELLVAPSDTRLGDLVGEPWPMVLDPDASLEDVVAAARMSRRSSLVVVDGDRRPLGRILLDDVIDALWPSSHASQTTLHTEVAGP
jgi:uncharacterized protein YrrD